MTTIDCGTCPARGQYCESCFVPVLAGAPGEEQAAAGQPPQGQSMPLTDAEWSAVDSFIEAGLVNPLDVLDLVATVDAPALMLRRVG